MRIAERTSGTERLCRMTTKGKRELAMKSNIEPIFRNHTYHELPCKWIYRLGLLPRAPIQSIYKGFSPRESCSSRENISLLVEKMMHVLLAIAAKEDLELEKINVKLLFSAVISRRSAAHQFHNHQRRFGVPAKENHVLSEVKASPMVPAVQQSGLLMAVWYSSYIYWMFIAKKSKDHLWGFKE